MLGLYFLPNTDSLLNPGHLLFKAIPHNHINLFVQNYLFELVDPFCIKNILYADLLVA